jgi:hypothetical protein
VGDVDVGSGAGAEVVGPGAGEEVVDEAVEVGATDPFVVLNFELTCHADAAWPLSALTETSA